jgi:hypothetical protein
MTAVQNVDLEGLIRELEGPKQKLNAWATTLEQSAEQARASHQQSLKASSGMAWSVCAHWQVASAWGQLAASNPGNPTPFIP